MSRRVGILALGLGIAALLAAPTAAQAPKPAPAEVRQEVDKALGELPLFRVMAEYYPQDYKLIVETLIDGSTSGSAISKLALKVQPLYVALIMREAPKGNVANTLEMVKLVRDQAKAGLAIDGATCLTILGFAKTESPAGLILPAELVTREQTIAAALLKQTATAPEPPAPPIEEATMRTIGIAAYDALPADELRAAFQRIGGQPANANDSLSQTAYCEFNIALMNEILKRPPVEASRLFRGTLGAAAAEKKTP